MPLMAQNQGNTKKLSLSECYQIALKQNYEISLSSSQIDYANTALNSAKSGYLPSANYQFGYNRQLTNVRMSVVNGQILEKLPNYYNMSLNANYTVFDGFARENGIDKATIDLKSAEQSRNYTMEKIKHDVIRNYIAVVRAKQIVKIRQENLDLGNKDLERIKAQFDAGIIPINSVYAQEADLGQREIDLVQSQNDLNNAKATLLSVLAMNPDMEIEFEENDIPKEVNSNDIQKFKSQIGSLDNAIAQAVENRLDYNATKLKINAAEKVIESGNAGYYPTLSAYGGWSWANTTFDNFGDVGQLAAGLNLSVPLFDQFRTRTQVQYANIQVEQKKIEQLQLEQSIRSSLKLSFLNLASAEKSLEIAERSIKSSKNSYESAKERFAVGSGSILEVTSANTIYITGSINKITATYNYILAQKDILFAMGKFE